MEKEIFNPGENTVTIWTAQAPIVLECINRDGISYVKKEYIKKKYQDVAWIFETAYSYFIQRLYTKLKKPAEAESPIWLYVDPKWSMMSTDSVLLKLEIPLDEIVFFDRKKWGQILNLSYIGSDTQKAEFDKKLAAQGISYVTDVFETSFYPLLKQEVIKSWDSLFDIQGLLAEDVQGAVWCLKKEWIKEVKQL